MSTRTIGAHVSAAGGVDKALERAAAIGANCVQVFSSSPRVWARTPLSKIDPVKLSSMQPQLGIRSIFTHALYLINLASDNPEQVSKSRTALAYDLEFDALVKGSGVVVHLGSHQGRGWAASQEAVAEELRLLLAAVPASSHLLIENSAGQKGKLSSDLAEIRWLLDQVNSPKLGWCLDTCHAWAAGHKLSEVCAVISQFQLWETLKCIHTNDSRDPFASGRDRHANLGDGTIPPQEWQAFLSDPRVAALPLILEVPGLDGNGPDAENIQRLKKLCGEEI
jgi:deoxyribonuclease-4